MQNFAQVRGEYTANMQIRKYANTRIRKITQVRKSSQEYASRCAQVRKTKSSRMVRIRDTWFSAVYLCNDPSTSPMGNGVRGMAHREWCAGMVHRERCAGNGAQGMGLSCNIYMHEYVFCPPSYMRVVAPHCRDIQTS